VKWDETVNEINFPGVSLNSSENWDEKEKKPGCDYK
jgi:hypothetical protein